MKNRVATRKTLVPVLVALLAVALIVPTIATASDQGERVYIHPWADGACYPVTSRDVVVISWGWSACSKGLVIDFLEAIEQHEYELNDELLLETAKANKGFGGIEEYTGALHPAYRCIWDAEHKMAAGWQYELKHLPQGSNTLRSFIRTGYDIIDGGEWCDNWNYGLETCEGTWNLFVGWEWGAEVTIAVDEGCP